MSYLDRLWIEETARAGIAPTEWKCTESDTMDVNVVATTCQTTKTVSFNPMYRRRMLFGTNGTRGHSCFSTAAFFGESTTSTNVSRTMVR